MKRQTKYIAVRPNGDICGPVGDDYEFVKQSLITGYYRSYPACSYTLKEVWKKIKREGYRVQKAKIKLLPTNR